MAQTNINIRMDEELKKNFDMICTELGLNMTAAINVFARAVVRKHGIPFDLTINDDFFYSEANVERLRKSIEDMSTLQRKITVSVGAVTISPKSDCVISFDDIFKITDSKLYEAKRSGRNRIKHAHLEY